MCDDIVQNFDAPNVKGLFLTGNPQRIGLRNKVDFSQSASDSFV